MKNSKAQTKNMILDLVKAETKRQNEQYDSKFKIDAIAKEIAEDLGINIHTFKSYMYNNNDPTLFNAFRIANYFGKSIEEIFEIIPEKTEN